MKLEEIKRIADARTKGEWRNPPGWTGSAEDRTFIAMAANNFDKLMAVVDAAKAARSNLGVPDEDYPAPFKYAYDDLNNALKALEAGLI